MSAPFLPIVYVRGYAATQSEINSTVDDPFYGFNLGSTHIRVGAHGEPVPFFFESPLVRLMSEHGYVDAYHGANQALLAKDSTLDAWRTVWIYRYYDATADTFNWKPNRLSIEDAALQLRDLIKEIKTQTGAPQVHLVAHSMGGLVCRSLLQKIYPEAGEKPEMHVSRFFTYATPHGGIQLRSGLGLFEKLRDMIGPFDSDTFGPDRMYSFLTPGKTPKSKAPRTFDPRQPSTAFNPDKIFCAIGTNASDYETAGGLSRAAVGPQSDGLVQIEAAYVHGAHRSYVHRCHSGRYGIVNSEEAFQSLERFLFGTIQAIVSLENLAKLPPAEEKSYQLDLQVAVRGLPVFMNERTRAHYCPIVLNDADKTKGKPVSLFTQFLNSRRSATNDGICRFAITIGLYTFAVVNGKVDYSKALHGLPNWYDTLLVDVRLEENAPPTLTAWWTAPEPDRQVDPKLKKTPEGGWSAAIPLPDGIARTLLGPDASLRIEAYNWLD